jgi:pSer/pThr/pTyr-binding forkhead associated (FHA) protein
MQVKLVVAKGSSRKQAIELRSAETVIGRRRGCDVRVSASQVSRRHCLLSVHEGYVTVQDLDSVNGTYVNGVRIEGKRTVQPGDRLDIGPVTFVVDYVPSGTPAAAQEPVAAEVLPGAELEVLPAVEEAESPFAFVNDAEALDELELVDEDTDYVPKEAEEIEEVLPVDEDEGDDRGRPRRPGRRS